jgi:hypothetical protein
MTEKILYYIGAGASACALPLAKTVWNLNTTAAPSFPIMPAIPGLAYSLKEIDIERIFSAFSEERYQEYKIKLKKNFSDLSVKADEFGDVDTYAKYLYLKESSELGKVKRTLSQFFLLEQMILGKKDRRYLPWLIGIMETDRFPDNVKVLNWNYDFQLELSAANFGNMEDVNHIGSGFGYSPPFIRHYPTLDPTSDRNEELSVIHLNGVAGFTKPKGFFTSSIFQVSAKKTDQDILNYIIDEEIEPIIHFAWEKSQYHNSLMEKVLKMVEGTTIIVIIGYSFPFFNREIDKQIFNKLISSGTVNKIYYQDPVLTGEQLRAQFSLNPSIPIVHIKGVDNFHIPFEY